MGYESTSLGVDESSVTTTSGAPNFAGVADQYLCEIAGLPGEPSIIKQGLEWNQHARNGEWTNDIDMRGTTLTHDLSVEKIIMRAVQRYRYEGHNIDTWSLGRKDHHASSD